jgi:hypothetical protein
MSNDMGLSRTEGNDRHIKNRPAAQPTVNSRVRQKRLYLIYPLFNGLSIVHFGSYLRHYSILFPAYTPSSPILTLSMTVFILTG